MLWRILITVGDTISTVENVQCCGGFVLLWGDTISMIEGGRYCRVLSAVQWRKFGIFGGYHINGTMEVIPTVLIIPIYSTEPRLQYCTDVSRLGILKVFCYV